MTTTQNDRKRKAWWDGGPRKKGDYFKPGEEVTPTRYEQKLTVAEVLVCWMGLRYRMTDGSIHLEFNLRPFKRERAK